MKSQNAYSTCPECGKGNLQPLKSVPPQVKCGFCKTTFPQREEGSRSFMIAHSPLFRRTKGQAW